MEPPDGFGQEIADLRRHPPSSSGPRHQSPNLGKHLWYLVQRIALTIPDGDLVTEVAEDLLVGTTAEDCQREPANNPLIAVETPRDVLHPPRRSCTHSRSALSFTIERNDYSSTKVTSMLTW